MKVTAERLPASQVRLEIVSDREEFDAAVEKATRRVANTVTVPGFRRGKAPRNLVVRYVGRPTIVNEANGDLMDDLYRRALEQEDLTPITRPEVELLENEPLSFRVEVEVAPAVDVTGYESVRVEPGHYSVSDADVDEYLDQMREERSPWIDPPSPRPVQEGDEVVVDIAAFDGDAPFDEPTNGATFVLGRDNLLPQIREMILGATVGEPVERTVTFPETNPEPAEKPIAEGESTTETGIENGDSLDADADSLDVGDEPQTQTIPEQLLGKTLNYRVTVQSIKEREELPLDDELATALGNPNPQPLAELRADVYRNLKRQRETQARVDVINQIMEQLRGVATVDVGPALLQQQTEEDAARQLQQIGGMGIDVREIFGNNSEALQNFLDRIRPESEQRLTNTLIAREIAAKEQVEVTPDDIHAEVHRLGMSHAVLEDERSVELIDADLRERRLFDRLIEIATEGRGLIDDSPESVYALPEPEDDGHAHAHHHDDDDDHDDVHHSHAESPGIEGEAESLDDAEADAEDPATETAVRAGDHEHDHDSEHGQSHAAAEASAPMGEAESLDAAEAEAEDPATETAVRAGEHPAVAEPDGTGTIEAEHETTPAANPTAATGETQSVS